MRPPPRGVTGFADPKFWLALTCYGATIPLFMQGNLTWDGFHVVMPGIISFVVVSTLAWDYRIAGDPGRPHCLLLHAAAFVSVVFLLNRLMSLSDFAPLAPGGLPSFLSGWLGSTPYLGGLFTVFDFALKWLGFALILLMVSGAIIFPPRIATALLFIFGLVLVFVSVGRSFNPSVWTLFCGLALMFVAHLLQRVDKRKSRFWNQVAERLARSGPRPGMDMKIKIALLRELSEQRALGANQIRGLIAGQLDRPTNDPLLNPVCARVTDQIINHDHIGESRDGVHGWRCVLSLPEEEPDFFTSCARMVRVIVTLVFCAIYILSPIDFIPDATPVFGVLDDMLLGGIGLLSAFKTIWPGRQAEWAQRTLPFGE